MRRKFADQADDY